MQKYAIHPKYSKSIDVNIIKLKKNILFTSKPKKTKLLEKKGSLIFLCNYGETKNVGQYSY